MLPHNPIGVMLLTDMHDSYCENTDAPWEMPTTPTHLDTQATHARTKRLLPYAFFPSPFIVLVYFLLYDETGELRIFNYRKQ